MSMVLCPRRNFHFITVFLNVFLYLILLPAAPHVLLDTHLYIFLLAHLCYYLSSPISHNHVILFLCHFHNLVYKPIV